VIDAREALWIGLVDEVVPAAELMARAEVLAQEIAGQAPLAVAGVIRMVDEGLDLPLDLALLREAEHFGKLCDTADKAEGTKAFLEKRRAEWGGKRS
jgi:enoyl-CoA hydratase